MRYRVVALITDLLLQLLDVVGIVRVFVRAHFVEDDAEGPNISRLRLLVLHPELGRQIVRRAHFLLLVISLVACLGFGLLSDAAQHATIIESTSPRLFLLNTLNVTKVANLRTIILRKKDIE